MYVVISETDFAVRSAGAEKVGKEQLEAARLRADTEAGAAPDAGANDSVQFISVVFPYMVARTVVTRCQRAGQVFLTKFADAGRREPHYADRRNEGMSTKIRRGKNEGQGKTVCPGSPQTGCLSTSTVAEGCVPEDAMALTRQLTRLSGAAGV